MARPRSEEKRTALLAAATAAVASLGTAAPTLKIARDAGVAEGSLFRYFATKDDLLNQLYLDLKTDLMRYLVTGLPSAAGVEAQFRHLWERFIDWGLDRPDNAKAFRQLDASDKITAVSRSGSEAMSKDLQQLVERGFASGVLREQPVPFLWGVIQGIAVLVIDAAGQEGMRIEAAKQMGWDAMWGAIAGRGT